MPDPTNPANRKGPEVKLSLSEIEEAKELGNPEPDGEQESEKKLEQEIEKVSKQVNPEDSTLRAMEQ